MKLHVLALTALIVPVLAFPVLVEAQTKAPQGQGGQSQELTRAQQEKQAKQALLQRMYNMRIRFEQERAAAENMARANVRLATQQNYRHMDAPTVTGLRHQTNQQLTRFEQMFRCLDVDVEGNSGNTVVICGDNSGDISGRNVHAERDIVSYPGGTP